MDTSLLNKINKEAYRQELKTIKMMNIMIVFSQPVAKRVLEEGYCILAKVRLANDNETFKKAYKKALSKSR